MRKLLMIMVMALVAALPARAQVAPEITQLTQALGLSGIVDVMREEGLDYGTELADNLFAGRNDASWTQVVSRIYDRDRMRRVVTQVFAQSIQGQDVAGLTAFFQSPLGQRIVTLETSARRALLDKSVEASNKARTREMLRQGGTRVDLLAEFIDVNDMIEANVVGALNSNFAFFTGLSEGRAAADRRSESQILEAVRSDEDGIRQDVTDWLYEYLSMAYSPLSDAELQQYIDLSRTPAGQALNTALFASFDEMFRLISRDLGQAASRIIASEDL